MSEQMNQQLKLVINGCAGRMGQALTRLVLADARLQLAGGLEAADSDALGQDVAALAGLPPCGVTASDDALRLLSQADAVIDFTAPAATVELAGLAAQARIVHIIGTTGFTAAQEADIAAAARHAKIVKSGNMSLGINLLAGLVRQAAQKLGTDWDIEILDMHHRHKVDAPSGTALLLAEAAADGRNVALDDVKESGRDGITGARQNGAIGIAALRGGSVVGDHEVIFASENEQIRLSHRAEQRDIFARGALAAALWAAEQSEGLYSMADVLGLAEQ
ncbi:MAG: 4-hydroxy-tetrahydrodipicolinate reductase [Parvibaculales bacterium]